MIDKTYDYANLDALPEFADQANSLVEEAFAYQKNFKFSVDFAPLSGPRNYKNRHILIDRDTSRVVAHIGTRLRNFVWEGEVIPVAMIGGIAVASSERGQGLFKLLFEKVLSSLHSQCALYVLWSDKHEMYQKWHFYLAGQQWCYRSTLAEKDARSTRLSALSQSEVQELAQIYRQQINQQYFSPLRDESDWEDLKDIESAELLLVDGGYAFRGKGMDLQGILHDSAHRGGVNGLLQSLGGAGVLWAAKNEPVPDEILQDLQQVGLWRPNTHPMALRKLSHLLKHTVHFRDDVFVVEKDGLNVRLNAEELLAEIFDYGRHRLRSSAIPVYIGGLDSI
ncbi:MAG: GNAT family N-acetyltransferase [Bacteriovoracia bacterium]